MKFFPRAALCALVALGLPVGAAVAAAPDRAIYAGWTRPGPPPLERFVEPLRLTLTQQQKLQPIFEDAQIKASQDQGDTSKSHAPNAYAEASVIAAREAAFRERLSTVLTAGQFTLYERISDAHLARLRVKTPALPVLPSQETRDAPETLDPPRAVE